MNLIICCICTDIKLSNATFPQWTNNNPPSLNYQVSEYLACINNILNDISSVKQRGSEVVNQLCEQFSTYSLQAAPDVKHAVKGEIKLQVVGHDLTLFEPSPSHHPPFRRYHCSTISRPVSRSELLSYVGSLSSIRGSTTGAEDVNSRASSKTQGPGGSAVHCSTGDSS